MDRAVYTDTCRRIATHRRIHTGPCTRADANININECDADSVIHLEEEMFDKNILKMSKRYQNR